MRIITTTTGYPAVRSPWMGLENEMDRLFQSALTRLPATLGEAGVPIDVYEDKDNTYVRAELPGVTREDIGVEMVDGYLTLQASRKQEDATGQQSLRLARSIALPEEVQADKVSAAYENGVLTVTLPKREESKPRKVIVSVK